MELIIKKQIGKRNYNFVFQGTDFHDVIMQSENLSFPDVEKCAECGSTDLFLNAYITEKEGYKYVKVSCAKCRASITFGKSKKNPNQYFLRKTEDGKYDWRKYQDKDAPKPKDDFKDDIPDSSIPF